MIRRALASILLLVGFAPRPAAAQVQVAPPALAYQLRLRNLTDSSVVLARLRCQYGPVATRTGCIAAEAIAVRDSLSPVLLVFSRWRLIDSLRAWKPQVDTIYDAPFARPESVHGSRAAPLGYNQQMMGVGVVCDSMGLCGQGVTVGVMDCGFAPPADVAIRWGQTLDVFGDSANFQPVNPGDDHGDNVAGIALSSIFGIAKHARGGLIRVSVPGGSCGVFGYSMGRGLNVLKDSSARVATASIGGAMIDQAQIDAFTAWGGFFCAAAGNSGGTPVTQPAAQPGVLAITALGTDTTTTGYASWGPEIWSGAPGDAIVSDGPCLNIFQPGCLAGSSTTQMSGTSMASPGCAGAIAVALTIAPTINRDVLISLFQQAAIDRGLPGRDDHYGFGLMNVRGVIDSLVAHGQPTFVNQTTQPCLIGQHCSGAATASGSQPFDVFATNAIWQHVDSIVGRRVYWSGIRPADSLTPYPTLTIRGQ